MVLPALPLAVLTGRGWGLSGLAPIGSHRLQTQGAVPHDRDSVRLAAVVAGGSRELGKTGAEPRNLTPEPSLPPLRGLARQDHHYD